MAKVTPEEYQEKHARRLKGATVDIQRGVERVTEAPGKAAAKAKDKMRANLLAAIDNGTWETKVAAVGLDDWKKAIIEKGISRIAAGVDAAKDKTIAKAARLLNEVDNAVAEVRKMPNVTIDDSIARMTTYARKMHAAKGKI